MPNRQTVARPTAWDCVTLVVEPEYLAQSASAFPEVGSRNRDSTPRHQEFRGSGHRRLSWCVCVLVLSPTERRPVSDGSYRPAGQPTTLTACTARARALSRGWRRAANQISRSVYCALQERRG